MSTRKHRIFIIGAALQRPPLDKAKMKVEAATIASSQAVQSSDNRQLSRRKLFQPVKTYKRSSSHDLKTVNRHTYQIEPHIKVQPIGNMLSCDLFHQNQVQRAPKETRPNMKVAQTQTENCLLLPQQQNNFESEQNIKKDEKSLYSINEHSFSTSIRKRLFDPVDIQALKKQNYSTLSSSRRRNIFVSIQANQNSLNTSYSKGRRRIFSHQSRQPILSPVRQKKQEQEYSRILPEVIGEEEEDKKSSVIQYKGQLNDGNSENH